jgi:hypothetical protein
VTAVTINGGHGDDEFDADDLLVAATIAGGDGDDVVYGGEAADWLSSGAGDDRLWANAGDTISGGSGIDAVTYWPRDHAPLWLTLDGRAAGASFDGVEDVQVFGDAPVTLEGDGGANQLDASRGDDVLVGAAGADTLRSQEGDDRIEAGDGFPDRVDCGPGTDVANVDRYDQVGDSCESVLVADVPGAGEDRAPRVRLRAPARLRAGRSATLRARVSDDGRMRQVRFLGDGRELCADRRAPFTCVYRPRPGRRTLVAVATDDADQTATAVRSLRVG